MAGPFIRVAAGMGLFAAVVMVGVPGVADSAADPSGSHSQSRDERHSEGHRGRGHDRRDTDRGGPGGVVADQFATSLAVTVEIIGTVAASPAPPVVHRRGSSWRLGADRVSIAAPRVTVGNGRSPGTPSRGPDALPERVVPVSTTVLPPAVAPRPPVVGAPVPPAPVELPVQRLEPTPPVVSVAPFVGTLHAGWPAGVLFGIAGLILAPIGGVWLGHRQARAAEAASHFVSR